MRIFAGPPGHAIEDEGGGACWRTVLCSRIPTPYPPPSTSTISSLEIAADYSLPRLPLFPHTLTILTYLPHIHRH